MAVALVQLALGWNVIGQPPISRCRESRRAGRLSRCLSNRRSRLLLFGVVASLLATVGCTNSGSNVPVGDPAENLRKLALAYVQFAAKNRGVGPADKQALKNVMVRRNQLSEQEADARFVSPRDNEPYVVRWGMRPEGGAPMGPDPPKPPIIIYEKTGADGTRYVADGRLKIVEMSQEEFSNAVPDHQN